MSSLVQIICRSVHLLPMPHCCWFCINAHLQLTHRSACVKVMPAGSLPDSEVFSLSSAQLDPPGLASALFFEGGAFKCCIWPPGPCVGPPVRPSLLGQPLLLSPSPLSGFSNISLWPSPVLAVACYQPLHPQLVTDHRPSSADQSPPRSCPASTRLPHHATLCCA